MTALLALLLLSGTPSYTDQQIEVVRLRLIQKGVCNGCADLVALHYVLYPKSSCGKEAALVLADDKPATQRLTNWFGSVCRPKD